MGTSSPLLPNVFSRFLLHYALWLRLAISPLPNVFTINISILPLSVSAQGNAGMNMRHNETFKEEHRKRTLRAMQTNTRQQSSALSMSVTCKAHHKKGANQLTMAVGHLTSKHCGGF